MDLVYFTDSDLSLSLSFYLCLYKPLTLMCKVAAAKMMCMHSNTHIVKQRVICVCVCVLPIREGGL